MSFCRVPGSEEDIPRQLPPSKGESESPATLSGSNHGGFERLQDQASGLAGGLLTEAPKSNSGEYRFSFTPLDSRKTEACVIGRPFSF